MATRVAEKCIKNNTFVTYDTFTQRCASVGFVTICKRTNFNRHFLTRNQTGLLRNTNHGFSSLHKRLTLIVQAARKCTCTKDPVMSRIKNIPLIFINMYRALLFPIVDFRYAPGEIRRVEGWWHTIGL
jgi:hypothetical protein